MLAIGAERDAVDIPVMTLETMGNLPAGQIPEDDFVTLRARQCVSPIESCTGRGSRK
jgi:hypothetical protein